jgi:hypothetical protein
MIVQASNVGFSFKSQWRWSTNIMELLGRIERLPDIPCKDLGAPPASGFPQAILEWME